MPAPLPTELRERIIRLRQKGKTQQETAELMGVSARYVQHLERQLREEGSIEPRGHRGGRKPGISEQQREALRQAIAEQPDATLEELIDRCDLDVTAGALSRTLTKMGLPRKRKTLRHAEADRPDVQLERNVYIDSMPGLDPRKLVFLDESNAKTDMTRRYGRGPIGQRVFEAVPDGRYSSLTMLGALTIEGAGPMMVYPGGTDIPAMLAYVRSFLLRFLRPDSIVIMDNLASHRNPKVIEAIQSEGATVKFLPRYSPEFNPIEEMWSKVKEMLRTFKARTKQQLYESIGWAIDCVTTNDAKGWFKHSGYRTNA